MRVGGHFRGPPPPYRTTFPTLTSTNRCFCLFFDECGGLNSNVEVVCGVVERGEEVGVGRRQSHSLFLVFSLSPRYI